jgi:nicotinate-nucleotide adenylyltransferase
MKLGIFGGTFNPPHLGHLVVAEHVREELELDRILFVPSAVSPHKQHRDLVAPAYRLEMVRLSIIGQPLFESSSIEIARGGVSFTVDTLETLKRDNPEARLHLLMGMDNLDEFTTWRSPERIVDLSRVVIMTRPGFRTNSVPESFMREFHFCQVPEIGISSSEIRERIKKRRSIRYLVPRAVESYIYYRRLYQ